MKPLLFKIPSVDDRSFRIEQDNLAHFYGHLHFHPEIQLTLIQEGEGTLIAGDKIDRFMPYDILMLGTNLPHVLRSDPAYFQPDSTRRSTSVSILFRPEQLASTVFELPETRHLNQLLQESRHGVRFRSREGHPLAEQLTAIPGLRPFEQFLSLLTILDYLAANPAREVLSVVAYEQPQRPEDHRRLEQVFSYILERYDSPISLDDVANIANLTPGAFCRFFRQHTRKKFSTLLNEVRIEHACRHLRESKQTISQIAFSCGYTNLSNFNRQFKEVTGLTPGDYIRSYHNQQVKKQFST
ncbi:helix-turn-helix domain-containing protein [Spirosoma sp. HMF4905]|uniref:Helix-turn-helix domain-containing protein n=1 Tax=Spirosoma arboris TaxID=2682092 RepID=A0A7K1SI61_9BACT|nr:AraC family transcriptional regulator [Spirosoma arboris]MVM33453.1 helix-turn-helix domain-containing protein [Spirosoma arboris]